MLQHKNKHLKLFVTLYVFLLSSMFCYSQQTVDVSDIALIAYNKKDAGIRLFREKQKNRFIEVYLEFHKSHENIFITTYLKENAKEIAVALEDIKLYHNDVLVPVDSIRKTQMKEVLKSEYELRENEESDTTSTQALVLKFLNNSIATIQKLHLEKEEHHKGFGVQVARKDDNVEKWRVKDAEYLSTVDLNFGKDKHLYVLLDEATIEATLLPLCNNDYLVSNENGMRVLKTTSKYKTSYFESFDQLNYTNFIAIHKTKNNTYQLVNTFQQNVLKTAYDTIMYNQFFIIGKHKNQVAIFNSRYENLNIDAVKSAYLYKSGLEILNDEGANYYDSELNIIEKFPPKHYMLCGTVFETSYKITYNNLWGMYMLTKTDGGFAAVYDAIRAYYLVDIKKGDKVTFLNNAVTYHWNENDDFLGNKYVYPQFLKITRRNKSGIMEYNYHNSVPLVDTISKENLKEVVYTPDYIKGKMVLPITNDSITFNTTDGLIYFYRKNKIGIFPRHTTVQYESIRQITNSFYAIIRDKKWGWLDIKTNIEYYDN